MDLPKKTGIVRSVNYVCDPAPKVMPRPQRRKQQSDDCLRNARSRAGGPAKTRTRHALFCGGYGRSIVIVSGTRSKEE